MTHVILTLPPHADKRQRSGRYYFTLSSPPDQLPFPVCPQQKELMCRYVRIIRMTSYSLTHDWLTAAGLLLFLFVCSLTTQCAQVTKGRAIMAQLIFAFDLSKTNFLWLVTRLQRNSPLSLECKESMEICYPYPLIIKKQRLSKIQAVFAPDEGNTLYMVMQY